MSHHQSGAMIDARMALADTAARRAAKARREAGIAPPKPYPDGIWGDYLRAMDRANAIGDMKARHALWEWKFSTMIPAIQEGEVAVALARTSHILKG